MMATKIDIFALARQAGFDVSDGIIDANGEAQGVRERIMVTDELRKFTGFLLEELAKQATERGREFGTGMRGDRARMSIVDQRGREAGCISVAQMMRKMKTQL
jgi:hypothetical protein